MPRDQKPTHYENIEDLSEQFQIFQSATAQQSPGAAERGFKIFTIRAMLAIAQQLSVISQTLKDR